MNLTIDQATALRTFLESQCISYYEVELRASIKSTILFLNELITELNAEPEWEKLIEETADIEAFNEESIESLEETNEQ